MGIHEATLAEGEHYVPKVNHRPSRSKTEAPVSQPMTRETTAIATVDGGVLASVTEPIRLALALIYFYFGFLKFFGDMSAAEMLSTQTILRLRLGLDARTALHLLACFEVGIAAALVLRLRMRFVFPVLLAHLAGAMAPLVLLPELMFKFVPFAPTLEGQYVIKNFVLIAAGWVLYRAEWHAGRRAL